MSPIAAGWVGHPRCHRPVRLEQSGPGGVGRRGRTLEVTRPSSAIRSGAGVSQVEGHGLTHVLPIMGGCESAFSPVVVTVLG